MPEVTNHSPGIPLKVESPQLFLAVIRNSTEYFLVSPGTRYRMIRPWFSE